MLRVLNGQANLKIYIPLVIQQKTNDSVHGIIYTTCVIFRLYIFFESCYAIGVQKLDFLYRKLIENLRPCKIKFVYYRIILVQINCLCMDIVLYIRIICLILWVEADFCDKRGIGNC